MWLKRQMGHRAAVKVEMKKPLQQYSDPNSG